MGNPQATRETEIRIVSSYQEEHALLTGERRGAVVEEADNESTTFDKLLRQRDQAQSLKKRNSIVKRFSIRI